MNHKAIHIKDLQDQDLIVLTHTVTRIINKGAERCEIWFSDGSVLEAAVDFQEILEILQTP